MQKVNHRTLIYCTCFYALIWKCCWNYLKTLYEFNISKNHWNQCKKSIWRHIWDFNIRHKNCSEENMCKSASYAYHQLKAWKCFTTAAFARIFNVQVSVTDHEKDSQRKPISVLVTGFLQFFFLAMQNLKKNSACFVCLIQH